MDSIPPAFPFIRGYRKLTAKAPITEDPCRSTYHADSVEG